MKVALEATKKNATDVVNKIMDKEEGKSSKPTLVQEKAKTTSKAEADHKLQADFDQMMKSGEEQKNLDNMSVQDLVNAKTKEALKKDQLEAEKFNKEAKEQSLKMSKGFEELINDTAKLTSANGNDSEYAPEAG